MVVTYTKGKYGFRADVTIEINSTEAFNEWAMDVSKELWDGMWFRDMEADGVGVNFGAFVTEGELALPSTDFELMMKRIEHTKIKPAV